MASLLEVGTGFHPELTGRENVFPERRHSGMTRAEIRANSTRSSRSPRLRSFSTLRSNDTLPACTSAWLSRSRPSRARDSGRRRSLAVGDAEFQKKCLGKLGDMSNSGRTVLFVSHNMAAIKSLTKRSIVLNDGRVIFDGTTESQPSKLTSNLGAEVRWRNGMLMGERKTYSFTRGSDAR